MRRAIVMRVSFPEAVLHAVAGGRVKDVRAHLEAVLADEIEHLMNRTENDLSGVLEASIKKAKKERAA